MRLTLRGQGVVVGLLIAVITVLAMVYNKGDENYTIENGEPAVISVEESDFAEGAKNTAPTGAWIPSGALPRVDFSCIKDCS